MSPMLTALPIELHTHIFSNLQPYDILQVSQTCQALYRASSQRTLWTDALHQICVENALFEPSFPVASMSVIELQRASMGPHRWIARTSSKERNSDGVLPHSVTRHLMSTMSDLSIADLRSLLVDHYLVPGGRYFFALSDEWLVLWDLGSPYSSGIEPHSVAAVPVKFQFYGHHLVHSTPDGMGLRVFLLEDPSTDMASACIYEIYPESTSPQLTQIASTRIPGPYSQSFFSLSYDRLIFVHRNTLTVWDYKADTWARWGLEEHCSQIVATKSAVVLIRRHGISVWKIPPLLPESSLLMSIDPSVMPPVFELEYPENQLYCKHHRAPCDWYSGTPRPLYYDVEEDPDSDIGWDTDSEDADSEAEAPLKINRFKVTINSKVSGGTLNLLKAFEVPSFSFSMNARICQDKDVSLCIDSETRFLRTHVTDIYDQQLPSFLTPLSCDHIDICRISFCPVTGRVVYCEINRDSPPSIIVLDF